LNNAVRFLDFISQQPAAGSQQFIAHLSDKARPLKQLCAPAAGVIILIGPEGDFSDKELQLALAGGFQVCTLGASRLRTETAAVVACSMVAMMNG
jgi:16S rRNA (uracil1498-N3)-methyltransferase